MAQRAGLIADVSAQLRDILARHGASLRTTFAAFDVDSSGTISRSEFHNGMRQLSVDVSDRDTDAVSDLPCPCNVRREGRAIPCSWRAITCDIRREGV